MNQADPTGAGQAVPGEDTVRVEVKGDVWILTLNRPEKLNAANLDMQRALLRWWTAIREDDRVRAVVVTGAGRAFCAGGDLSIVREYIADNRLLKRELGQINRDMLACLLDLEVPVIAAINGPAVGFGAGLAALCDVVVMADTAFISDPHVKYGIAASPACQLVWPHLTSRAIAKELLMSGRAVPAEEAVRIGLANRVHPAGEEFTAALELAQQLAALPRSGVASVKRALNLVLTEEVARMDEAGETHDATPDR